MLTTMVDGDCAGINGVEWDAVELPSQFMENWCYHRPTVDQVCVRPMVLIRMHGWCCTT